MWNISCYLMVEDIQNFIEDGPKIIGSEKLGGGSHGAWCWPAGQGQHTNTTSSRDVNETSQSSEKTPINIVYSYKAVRCLFQALWSFAKSRWQLCHPYIFRRTGEVIYYPELSKKEDLHLGGGGVKYLYTVDTFTDWYIINFQSTIKIFWEPDHRKPQLPSGRQSSDYNNNNNNTVATLSVLTHIQWRFYRYSRSEQTIGRCSLTRRNQKRLICWNLQSSHQPSLLLSKKS